MLVHGLSVVAVSPNCTALRLAEPGKRVLLQVRACLHRTVAPGVPGVAAWLVGTRRSRLLVGRCPLLVLHLCHRPTGGWRCCVLPGGWSRGLLGTVPNSPILLPAESG